MAINGLNNNVTNTQNNINNTNNVNKEESIARLNNKLTNATDIKKSTDAVSVSDVGQKLNIAQEKAKNSSGIDEKKVANIKKAIEKGTFKIDYDALASEIIKQEIDLSDIYNK
ncbi:MAG: flagellar biosynthesis anti-sigma factor FlgM [Succinivibrionaceae bacterium]